MMSNTDQQIGIDIGGTHLRIGIVRDGTVVSCGVYRSAEVFASGHAADALVSLIRRYADTAGGSVQAVSIGIPGSVCNDHRTIYCTPNLFAPDGSHLFENYDLASPLEQELGIPVYLNKDVNNLLRFDMALRPHPEKEILLGAYIGTGYGTAASVFGNVLEGAHGVAMDMGHMPLYHARQKCSCGKTGCAEAYASGLQLTRLQRKLFPKTPLEYIFLEHSGDEVIQEFIYACALPLATLAGAFDPHAIIIGGGVTEMEGFPRELLERLILEHVPLAVSDRHPCFYYSPNRADKGVIGAALYAQQQGKKEV